MTKTKGCEEPGDFEAGAIYDMGVADAKNAILDMLTDATGENGSITKVGVEVLRMEIAELTSEKLKVTEE